MILVTGGTGFLGSHLVARLLERGAPIRLLCRRAPTPGLFDLARTQVVPGDVTDEGSLVEAFRGIRRVYHVAGKVDFQPRRRDELLAVNVQGTRNVLAAAERAGVERIVHVSSVSTIGATSDPSRPLDESHFGKGLGTDLPYPRSKLLGEQVALEFAARGLPVVIVNPTFFTGPGDRNLSSARTVVSFVQRQVWVGLTRGGMGITDVRDVAEGAIRAMERGQPGQRYILGGHNLLLREYHALLGRLTGLRPPRWRVPPWMAIPLAVLGRAGYRLCGVRTYVGVGDIRLARHYWMYDYTRASCELGLVCRSPEESLRDTLAWLAQSGYYTPRRDRPGPPRAS